MRYIIASFLVIVLLGLVAATPGCGTTPKQKAYTSLAAIGNAVDGAMKSAASLKVGGQINQESWDKIAVIYDKYAPAYGAAVAAAQLDYTQPAPPVVVQLAGELLQLAQTYVVRAAQKH
jgi:hypothetical protein